MRARVVVVLAVMMAAVTGAAQVPGRFQGPQPCHIRIDVSYADGREKVAFVTVELMDALGSSSAMDRKETDKDGRAEFNSMTGKHRVRITGAGIAAYEGEFQVEEGESMHWENIRVRRSASGSGTPAGLASASRLAVSDKAKREFAKGKDSMQEKNWKEARQHFEAAIAEAPDYDLAYNGLGVAAMQLNDAAAARTAFEKATALNDKFAEAQRNFARILLAEKDFGKAGELLEKSLSTDPDNAWALTNVAFAELQLKKYAEAAAHAQRVHGVSHEGLANAHMIAAYALDAQGKKSEAISEFKLYLKEDPKGPNVQRAKENLTRLQAQ